MSLIYGFSCTKNRVFAQPSWFSKASISLKISTCSINSLQSAINLSKATIIAHDQAHSVSQIIFVILTSSINVFLDHIGFLTSVTIF